MFYVVIAGLFDCVISVFAMFLYIYFGKNKFFKIFSKSCCFIVPVNKYSILPCLNLATHPDFLLSSS